MRPLAVTIALTLLVLAAAHARSSALSPQPLIQRVAGGTINWGENVFSATGDGLIPSASEEPNRSKAYLKAKGHARTKGIANLLLTIDATPVNYAVTGRELMALDDALRRTVENLALGAEITSDRRRQDAGEAVAEVTVELPMYGPGGPCTALLRGLTQQERLGHASAQVKVQTPRPKVRAEAPANQKGPFTALIIDARGFNLQKAIDPRIRRPDSSEVWGTFKLESALPLNQGPTAYCASIDDAKKDARAGRNPLIVRAVGRAGGPVMCDAVVTVDGADVIVAENKSARYLDQYRVIFVIDPVVD